MSTLGLITWKKNKESIFIEANDDCANLFDLRRGKDLVGKNDDELPCKASQFAEAFRQQDQSVMTLGKSLKTIDIHPYGRDVWKILLCVKSPLYGKGKKENIIIGTSGYAVDLTETFFEIGYLLSKNSNLFHIDQKSNKIQNSYLISQEYVSIKLTQRQSECLFLLLRGKTIKQIAVILNLSMRTITDHLDALKYKFHALNKSELIDKAIENGFINFIPQSFLGCQLTGILNST